MTRVRFVSAAIGALLVALAGGVSAAPVPKEVAADEPADLKALHALIAKAVKDESKLSAEDDKKARDILIRLVERMVKEGELGERKLPVVWETPERTEVVKKWAQKREDKMFIIAGEMRGFANGSIILSSGDVSLNSCENSIVVGRNVKFTSASNSLVIAEEYVRGTYTAKTADERKYCLLVAGRWVRMTSLEAAACLVTRPSLTDRVPGGPPDDTTPIRMTSAQDVVFLNPTKHLELSPRWKFRIAEPKKPIAK